MAAEPIGAPLTGSELDQIHPSTVVLRLVPEIKGSSRQERRAFKRATAKVELDNGDSLTLHLNGSKKFNREILFPVSSEKLVAHLFENIETDTNLVLGGLDSSIEELAQNILTPLATQYKKDLAETPLKKLINSLSATGVIGVQRTEGALNEIFNGALRKEILSGLASELRSAVDEFRKGKSYVYNQNKCVNSFLNLTLHSDGKTYKDPLVRQLKTLESVFDWSEDLINLWKKSKIIQSENSLSTYQNVFKNFIKVSVPDFTYGEFLSVELRKYLSIPAYEKFKVKFQEFGELSWQERALCAQTDPEAFFPEKGGSTREAKRVCMSCDVRIECLDYALRHEERFGIWGGLSERERRRLAGRSNNEGQIIGGASSYLGGLRRLGEFLGLIDSENESAAVNQDDQIKTFHPKSFSDGRDIGDALRTGKVVIMNCTEMNEDDRKRIVDFVSGLIFASGGSIERVSNKVFLLTPSRDIVKSSNFDITTNQSLSS
jgi:WhiB family redox-sensing transcriptional regulator